MPYQPEKVLATAGITFCHALLDPVIFKIVEETLFQCCECLCPQVDKIRVSDMSGLMADVPPHQPQLCFIAFNTKFGQEYGSSIRPGCAVFTDADFHAQ